MGKGEREKNEVNEGKGREIIYATLLPQCVSVVIEKERKRERLT